MGEATSGQAARPPARPRPDDLGVPGLGDEFWLFEIAPRLLRLENAALRRVTPPLTQRQFRLLRRVAEGDTNLTAIGGRSTLSMPTISASLDALVRKSLLRRRRQSRDRRSQHLTLTADGERALAEAQHLVGALAARLFESFPDDRRNELRRDFVVINRHVTTLLRDGPSGGVVMSSTSPGVSCPH